MKDEHNMRLSARLLDEIIIDNTVIWLLGMLGFKLTDPASIVLQFVVDVV